MQNIKTEQCNFMIGLIAVYVPARDVCKLLLNLLHRPASYRRIQYKIVTVIFVVDRVNSNIPVNVEYPEMVQA